MLSISKKCNFDRRETCNRLNTGYCINCTVLYAVVTLFTYLTVLYVGGSKWLCLVYLLQWYWIRSGEAGVNYLEGGRRPMHVQYLQLLLYCRPTYIYFFVLVLLPFSFFFWINLILLSVQCYYSFQLVLWILYVWENSACVYTYSFSCTVGFLTSSRC